MVLLKETCMTTPLYNIGDIIIVQETFKHDACTFYVGNRGKVVDNVIFPHYLGIEWLDGKTNRRFHSCGGNCSEHSGYNVDIRLLKLYTSLEPVDTSVVPNPLPTDPRLRGIALKIIQLDTKFKRYQELKKSGQLHLLTEDDEEEEEEDEWEEDYDTEDYETVRG